MSHIIYNNTQDLENYYMAFTVTYYVPYNIYNIYNNSRALENYYMAFTVIYYVPYNI